MTALAVVLYLLGALLMWGCSDLLDEHYGEVPDTTVGMQVTVVGLWPVFMLLCAVSYLIDLAARAGRVVSDQFSASRHLEYEQPSEKDAA